MPLTRERLVEFLVENFSLSEDELEDQTPLFSRGLIDSFGLVDLVAFLEKTCACKLGAMEVNLENLDTIERILRFLSTKKAASKR